jgi:hypothetical protein
MATGRDCMAGSRQLLHESQQADYGQRLIEGGGQAMIGNPID